MNGLLTQKSIWNLQLASSRNLLTIAAMITPASLIYVSYLLFPFFDFNRIVWLDITKHIIIRLFVVFILFCTLIDFLRRHQSVFPRTGIERALIFYFLSIFLSILWSASTFQLQLLQNAPTLLSLIMFAILPLAIIYWLDSPQKIKVATRGMLAIGVVITSIAILQIVVGKMSFYKPSSRLSGIFWDPNIFGRYLCIISAFFMALMLYFRKKKKLFLLLLGIMVLISIDILLTYSRSSLITLTLMIIVVMWKYLPRKLFIPMFVLVCSGTLAILYFVAASRVQTASDTLIDPSGLNRIIVLLGGVWMIKNYWFIGVGFGNFRIVLEQIFGGTSYLFSETYRYYAGATFEIHSWFIEVWSEQGILGLCAFLYLFITILRTLKKAQSIALDPELKSYLLGHWLTVLVFLFHGLLYHTFITQFFFWCILSLGLATMIVSNRTIQLAPKR